jgi:hypothetical protein
VSLYSPVKVTTGPVQEHNAWLAAAVQRQRVRKGEAWLPEAEPCLAVPGSGGSADWIPCWYERMHAGAHSWQP